MTIDNLLNWLQEAEDNNTFMVSTQSVKRHLEKIQKEQLILCGVVKSFTAEEVVSELKENETLDDAISFFNSQ
jgi:hypothetical protein